MDHLMMFGLLLLGAAAGAVPTAIWYSGHIRQIKNLIAEASASPAKRAVPSPRLNTRRSTRVARSIPVLLTSMDPDQTFQQECQTSVINAHGCGLIVHEEVKRGTLMLVKLTHTGATREGTVVVVTPIEAGAWLVGLEFQEAGNFWGIANPPADWRVEG